MEKAAVNGKIPISEVEYFCEGKSTFKSVWLWKILW